MLPDSLSKHSGLKTDHQFSVASSISFLGLQTNLLGIEHYFHILSRLPEKLPIAESTKINAYFLNESIQVLDEYFTGKNNTSILIYAFLKFSIIIYSDFF